MGAQHSDAGARSAAPDPNGGQVETTRSALRMGARRLVVERTDMGVGERSLDGPSETKSCVGARILESSPAWLLLGGRVLAVRSWRVEVRGGVGAPEYRRRSKLQIPDSMKSRIPGWPRFTVIGFWNLELCSRFPRLLV